MWLYVVTIIAFTLFIIILFNVVAKTEGKTYEDGLIDNGNVESEYNTICEVLKGLYNKNTQKAINVLEAKKMRIERMYTKQGGNKYE